MWRMGLLAFDLVDLIAFVALGFAGVVLVAGMVGLAAWLRDRARRPDGGYYPGL